MKRHAGAPTRGAVARYIQKEPRFPTALRNHPEVVYAVMDPNSAARCAVDGSNEAWAPHLRYILQLLDRSFAAAAEENNDNEDGDDGDDGDDDTPVDRDMETKMLYSILLRYTLITDRQDSPRLALTPSCKWAPQHVGFRGDTVRAVVTRWLSNLEAAGEDDLAARVREAANVAQPTGVGLCASDFVDTSPSSKVGRTVKRRCGVELGARYSYLHAHAVGVACSCFCHHQHLRSRSIIARNCFSISPLVYALQE